MSHRLIVHALADAAPLLGVQHQSHSADWVQVITTSHARFFIMGYKWPLNNAGSSILADDKYATAWVLQQANVPCIEHQLFLRRDWAADPSPTGPFMTQLHNNAQSLGYPLVVKNNHGQGGEGVYLVEIERHLRHRVVQALAKFRGVAVSPLFDAPYEYRLVVLDHDVLLAFKKTRAQVVGDGHSTLAMLALAPQGPLTHIAEAKKESWLLSMEGKAQRIIPAGVSAPLEWRHNLAFGAQPTIIRAKDPLYEPLKILALRATQAIGLRFCSVDILENQRGELRVLEVNSGVSVEKFASALGPEGEKLGRAVYQKALEALVNSSAVPSLI